MVSGFGTPAADDVGMLRSAVRDNRRLALVYRDERERLTECTNKPLEFQAMNRPRKRVDSTDPQLEWTLYSAFQSAACSNA